MAKKEKIKKSQIKPIMRKIRRGEKLTREEKSLLKRYRKQKKSK